MKFGKEGQYVSVNSAHSVSRETVDSAFPEVLETRGNIPWELVVREVGADAVVGRVEIREQFRREYERLTGSAISDERARQLLRDYATDTWRGITGLVTRQNSLQTWVQIKALEREEGIATRTDPEHSKPKPPITDPTGGSSR